MSQRTPRNVETQNNTIRLPLEEIRADGQTQVRARLHRPTVAEYAEAMAERAAAFPPLVVYFDGTDHRLADGFHRLAAARMAGLHEIECDVRPGSRRDALLFAVGANTAHGLRRSNADKQRAVRILLQDAEWSQRSDRWIAERCGVSHSMVRDQRAQLEDSSSCHNDRAPASDSLRQGRDGKLRRTPKKSSEPQPLEPLVDRAGRTIFPYGCGTDIQDFETELRELWHARGASARLATGACSGLLDDEDTEYYEECIDRAAEVLETSVTMGLAERANGVADNAAVSG